MDSKETTRGSEQIQSPSTAMNRDEVERLAYLYWEERGCVHGCHDEDWYRAEADVRARAGSSPAFESPSASAAGETPMRTVIGVFHSLDNAQRAYNDLTSEGFKSGEVSCVANKAGITEWTEPASSSPDDPEKIKEGPKTKIVDDAGIGAAVGGVGGLLLSFAGLAVPGIGPVLAAGPIVAALGGAGVGAAAGGLIGALVEGGVPEEQAEHYAEGIRRGGVLIAVRASGDRADRAAELLDRAGAVDIDDRVSDWRTRGWSRHDAAAEPLTNDELRRERDYYSAADQQADEWQSLSQASPGAESNTPRESPLKGMASVETAIPRPAAASGRRSGSRIYGS